MTLTGHRCGNEELEKSLIMPINSDCLRHLQRLGLPLDATLVDRHGNRITNVRINPDGTATDLTSGVTYDQPSALRNQLSEPNGPTYPRLIYNGPKLIYIGQDLRSLGVVARP